MSAYCIIVADMARARFFNLEPVASSGFKSGPNLVEQGGLIIPRGELRYRDTFADTETGCNMGPGGATHSYDDHRSRHRLEFERRFAELRKVARERIAQLVEHFLPRHDALFLL